MHLGFRLSSKPLLTSDDYELGAGVRKRHKAPEEDPDALGGTGKARGRSQPWDEHEASSDFMSQVSFPPQAPIFQAQKVWCGGCVCQSSPSQRRSVGSAAAQRLWVETIVVVPE